MNLFRKLVGYVLQDLSDALLWVADILTDVAAALLRVSRRCLGRPPAEWDPRLWDRGQHTDLHPPPGA